MKICLVKRNDKIDWDEYNAFVVIAIDEQDALNQCIQYEDKFRIDNTDITEIIPSDDHRGIVLGSFNAG